MIKALRFALLAFAIVGFTAAAIQAQKSNKSSMQCRDNNGDGRLSSHCEIKEQTLPASGAITVDAKTNGGIAIKGWDRHEILVRAKIETRAPTQAEADQLAQQVRIETAALNIHAEGPESRNDYQWSVSYEILVPSRSDLTLTAHNGGISIVDVNGRIQFQTTNGGVSLARVGGAVTGNTTNGGVHVELAGTRWEGETLDVRTTNGGVNLVRVGGKWSLRTASDLAWLLTRESVVTRKLSRAAVETLAIVAYHQPVTRAEIEEIRGVTTSKGTLDVLLETGWVRLRGRRKAPGRPVTYGTTEGFLSHFGLDALADLPGLDELLQNSQVLPVVPHDEHPHPLAYERRQQ
jgi:segregation and condensation protein B